MDDRPQMSLVRLQALLEAYGAKPERWPAEERDAARALLAQSPQAQRWRDVSAQLDAVLDLAPAHAPSPTLLERIVAAAPRREPAPSRTAHRAKQPARAWRYAAATLPLAAAAALVLWWLGKPAHTPEGASLTVAELGTYNAPTDALLTTPSIAALDEIPSFGCTGSGLGCLEPEPLDNQSALHWERYV